MVSAMNFSATKEGLKISHKSLGMYVTTYVMSDSNQLDGMSKMTSLLAYNLSFIPKVKI